MVLATNILAGIFAAGLVLCAAVAAVLVIVSATVATMIFFTIDPNGAWPLVILAGYLVVAVGSGVGISDYYE